RSSSPSWRVGSASSSGASNASSGAPGAPPPRAGSRLSVGESLHPTAVVDPKALLGAGVRIGAYTVVGPEVALEEGVEVGHHVVLEGRVRVGAGSRIGHGSVVGAPPQDLKWKEGTPSGVRIGRGTTLREYATVHRATRRGGPAPAAGGVPHPLPVRARAPHGRRAHPRRAAGHAVHRPAPAVHRGVEARHLRPAPDRGGRPGRRARQRGRAGLLMAKSERV